MFGREADAEKIGFLGEVIVGDDRFLREFKEIPQACSFSIYLELIRYMMTLRRALCDKVGVVSGDN